MRQKVAGVAVTKQTDEEVQYPGSSWAKDKQVLTSWAEQRRQREAGSCFTVINQRGDEMLLTHLYHSVAKQTELQVDENHSKRRNLPLISVHHVWSHHLEFILEAILERLQLSCVTELCSRFALIVLTVFSAHCKQENTLTTQRGLQLFMVRLHTYATYLFPRRKHEWTQTHSLQCVYHCGIFIYVSATFSFKIKLRVSSNRIAPVGLIPR